MPTTDGLVPIPLALDLWALGHSQSQIAKMLGLPNRKHVERIIANARKIGDPRAVRHAVGTRILGKGIHHTKRFTNGRRQKHAGFEIVPLLEKAPT